MFVLSNDANLPGRIRGEIRRLCRNRVLRITQRPRRRLPILEANGLRSPVTEAPLRHFLVTVHALVAGQLLAYMLLTRDPSSNIEKRCAHLFPPDPLLRMCLRRRVAFSKTTGGREIAQLEASLQKGPSYPSQHVMLEGNGDTRNECLGELGDPNGTVPLPPSKRLPRDWNGM